MSVEIAVQDVEGAKIALQEGADRIELCAALGATGGITPSFALIGACAQIGVPQGVQALIRPRGGSFVFDRDEKNVQLGDVRAAILAGASGVVIGGLDADNRIDEPFVSALIETAHQEAYRNNRSVQITFHRAFDLVAEQDEALETLINLGCTRVLTSAGAPTAPKGVAGLRSLVEQAAGRIEIQAGGGVTAASVPELVSAGVDAIHFSGRRLVASDGGPGGALAARIERTDQNLVHQVIAAVHHAKGDHRQPSAGAGAGADHDDHAPDSHDGREPDSKD